MGFSSREELLSYCQRIASSRKRVWMMTLIQLAGLSLAIGVFAMSDRTDTWSGFLVDSVLLVGVGVIVPWTYLDAIRRLLLIVSEREAKP